MITIRSAKSTDGPAIMPILNQIFEEMEIPALQQISRTDLFNILEKLFQQRGFHYGYDRAIVAVDENGQVLGVAFSYPQTDEADIDAAFKPYLSKFNISSNEELFPDQEAFGPEWYLDSLAVSPKAQGQGIGSKLITAVKQKALTHHLPFLSLNVDLENPQAKRLYQRQGFYDVKQIKIGSHIMIICVWI